MAKKTLRGVMTGAVIFAIALLWQPSARSAETVVRVLATTFPVYQMTRNVATGVTGVEVELMIPAQMGCPHDYALVPQDMRKLARADILVINGLGLEEFLGAPLKKANPNLRLIDSSKGISQVLSYAEERSGKAGTHQNHGPDHDQRHHAHHETGRNPHLFASPRMAALMVGNIARELAKLHPAGAAIYTANGEAYSRRLDRLADDLAQLGRRLRNNRIVTQHGVFDYLARDMGLEVVAVVQAHPGQNPSAAEILDLVETIKVRKAGALFTEPQYPEAVGVLLAKEAGIASARLDPAVNGPERAPLDYYEQVMRTNLTTLEQTLGSN